MMTTDLAGICGGLQGNASLTVSGLRSCVRLRNWEGGEPDAAPTLVHGLTTVSAFVPLHLIQLRTRFYNNKCPQLPVAEKVLIAQTHLAKISYHQVQWNFKKPK